MSAEQTPDIETLAEVLRVAYLGPPRADAHLRAAQALAPVLAAAWDEGYAAAEHMARCWGHTDSWEDEPENPYRADRVAEPQHEAATSSEESEASDE